MSDDQRPGFGLLLRCHLKRSVRRANNLDRPLDIRAIDRTTESTVVAKHARLGMTIRVVRATAVKRIQDFTRIRVRR